MLFCSLSDDAVPTAYGPAWINPDDKTVGGVQASAAKPSKPKAQAAKPSKKPRAARAAIISSQLNDTATDPALAFDKRAVLGDFESVAF